MSGAEGYIGSAAKGGNLNIYTSYIEKYQKQVLEKNPEGMMIPFISNHDMDRSAGYLTMALNHCYMGANLYLLAPGSPFIYYGEEIGLKGTRGTAMTDANRRLAMLWGDDDKVSDPVGTTYNKGKQTNGTVKEQLEDSESLLNYYCKVISIRNKYPEIARGMYKSIQTDVKAGGFEISYNNELTYLFHNATTKEVSIDLSKYNISSIKDYIGMDSAKLEGTTLIIGPQTSVILK